MPVIPAAAPVPPVAPVPVVRQETYLIQWLRLKPENFTGTCEPWDAQAWFKTAENIVDLLDWPVPEKIKCVSFCFSGDARMWWERVKAKRQINLMN